MKWITRERPKVDRIACPWLIKKFVDADARFLFAAPSEVMVLARREDAIPYDVPGVELGHVGDECSFDAIIRKYGISDPAVQKMAAIVRGADTGRYDLTPESSGLAAIAAGFQANYEDDMRQLADEFPVYDALYAYCQQQLKSG